MKQLDSQEFYELMQAYRIAHSNDQGHVINKFNAVKDFIRKQNADLLEALKKVNHTLHCHGHIDANTNLHTTIEQAIEK